MTIVVLGCFGMLGFALHRGLTDSGHDVVGVGRLVPTEASSATEGLRYSEACDLRDIEASIALVESLKPKLVINAAALMSDDEYGSLYRINSVLPRILSQFAQKNHFRFVHFSTDGVFDGRFAAPYREYDTPNPEGAYSISKYLGESPGSGTTVLRTSLIGHGLSANSSLLDWLLSKTGPVPGFTQAWFTGLPVPAVVTFVRDYLVSLRYPLDGLWHLAATPITKYDLLCQLCERYGRSDISVVKDERKAIDRRLNAEALFQRTGWQAESWPQLIDDLFLFYSRHLPDFTVRTTSARRGSL